MKGLTSVHFLLFFFFSHLDEKCRPNGFHQRLFMSEKQSSTKKKKTPVLVTQKVKNAESKCRHGKIREKNAHCQHMVPNTSVGHTEGVIERSKINCRLKSFVDSLPNIAYKHTYLQCVLKDLH